MSSRPIKILQVFSSLGMGGAENRMMDVFRKIDRKRFLFDFLTMRPELQHFEHEIEELGGTVHKIKPPRERGSIGNIQDMCRIMKSGQYSAIHTHTSYHGALACLAAKLAGIPIRIAHARTTGSQNTTLMNRLALEIGHWLMPFVVTHRLAISTEAGKYLFRKQDFEILPNAIDCARFQNISQEAVQELRQAYCLPKSKVVIGMIGRFDPMKNHAFALNWFADFSKIQPESILVMIGNGKLLEDIKRLSHEAGLGEQVLFTGERTDVNVWMAIFDVVIMPSHFEGLGCTILEAQAAGKPVIKSNTFTNEADMGVTLVQNIPLDQGTHPWTKAVLHAIRQERPNFDIINQAFAKRKYSLDAEIESLSRLYSGHAL